ncbi:50S ribosomal protein L17 [Patescibacteria group bacterium]|nr:50S ribosomal protein L17 [Patescibacteria group bacterium]
MRHHKNTIKFGRQRSHYKATLRGMVSGLIINKSISTTKVRAKETSRIADRLVTMGKKNTVANQRRAYAVLRDRDLVSILFNEIAPLFKERNGGYTRVMLTQKRRGDNAQMAILEFVEKPKKEVLLPKKKEEKKKVKAEPQQPEPKPKEKVEKKVERKAEKKEKPEAIRPKKEEITKKEEPQKEIPAPREPEKPEEPKKKPGFFKRLFGKKKD